MKSTRKPDTRYRANRACIFYCQIDWSEYLPEFNKAKRRVTFVPCTRSQGDTGPLSATPTPQGPLLQQLPMEIHAPPLISEAACAAVAALAPHPATPPPNAASFQTARPRSQAHLQLLTLPAPGVLVSPAAHVEDLGVAQHACHTALTPSVCCADATMTSHSASAIDTSLRCREPKSDNFLSPELRSCFNHVARHSSHCDLASHCRGLMTIRTHTSTMQALRLTGLLQHRCPRRRCCEPSPPPCRRPVPHLRLMRT